MRPTTGTMLGERYRLVREIAVGGMGEVWVGHDDALARDVAVKVLREEFAGDPGFIKRFRTEARNSASLSHQNIAQLYDYGEQEGSAFLVMELVLGEPMSDLLEREPVLPLQRLLRILAQTSRALHAAHVAGVVHRDVKPGNILLGRAGRVKITDFGVSLATNQVPMTATGMVMGTAQYLSPEQAVGKPATPASDLYSLGIVAYESLAGNRPFTGPTAVDIAVAHVNSPVPPLPASVDPRLAAIVMRLLSKDPAERPRSAAALARSLDAMVEKTPPTGMSVVVAEPVARRPEPAAHAVEVPAAPTGKDPEPALRSRAAARKAAEEPPPPSYPPRRELRDSAEARRSSGSHRAQSKPVRRGPLTTGIRFGRLTWPLVALLFLVLAVLGAAVADRLTRAEQTIGTEQQVTAMTTTQNEVAPAVSLPGYPSPGPDDGMITERAPTATADSAGTTTAKDV